MDGNEMEGVGQLAKSMTYMCANIVRIWRRRNQGLRHSGRAGRQKKGWGNGNL